MDNLNKFEPPKSSTGDSAHLAAKEILSLIPGASALFEYFIQPPLEKRRENWMNMVAKALKDLEDARFDISKLQTDQRFITIVLQTTSVAIRNHQQEKLLALRNAIFNSANFAEREEDIQLLFIRFIDELTPSHLKLLKFFIENAENVITAKSYTELFQIFESSHQNSISQDEFRMLLQDLSARSLIRVSSDIDDFEDIYQVTALIAEDTNDKLPRVIITEMAQKFLNFISIEAKSAA